MEEELEELIIDYKIALDKSVILYGASGSGKSCMIIDILKHLNKYAKQIIVISPTDPTNGTYSKTWDDGTGIVPKPLIHYKLTEETLMVVWKRQEMFAAVYSRANQIDILEKLFRRLKLGGVKKILDKAEAAKAQCLIEIEDKFSDKNIQKKKKGEIEDKFTEFYTLTYKRYISANKKTLESMDLSVEEKFTLKYLSFNPRMVIVFDDCSADFKKIKSKEGKSVLEKMFFQNRWAYLTVIIAVHDDKLIDSELRKNAYLSIFTTKQSAYTYFSRGSNAFPRDMIKRVVEESKRVFTGHQKLAFVRQRDEIFRITATDNSDHPFTFGAESIRHFCGKIASKGGVSIDRNNEFYGYFCTPN